MRAADDGFTAFFLSDEEGLPREIAQLIAGPGDVLLFETAAGETDPLRASRARFLDHRGPVLTLYTDASYTPVPEPGAAGLLLGLALSWALPRPRARRRAR